MPSQPYLIPLLPPPADIAAFDVQIKADSKPERLCI
jgi:hypothetical protein